MNICLYVLHIVRVQSTLLTEVRGTNSRRPGHNKNKVAHKPKTWNCNFIVSLTAVGGNKYIFYLFHFIVHFSISMYL